MNINDFPNIIPIDDSDDIFYSVETLTTNNDDIITLSDTENDFFISHGVVSEVEGRQQDIITLSDGENDFF